MHTLMYFWLMLMGIAQFAMCCRSSTWTGAIGAGILVLPPVLYFLITEWPL